MSNKSKVIVKCIVSAFFGLSIFASLSITYDGDIYAKLTSLDFIPTLSSACFGIIAIPCMYLILTFLDKEQCRIHKVFFCSNRAQKLPKSKLWNFVKSHCLLASFILIFICWLPWLLVFAPGSVLDDTLASIGRSALKVNHHPVIYSAIVTGFAFIGQKLGNINFGIFLYTLVQLVILDLTCAFCIRFLVKCKVKSWYIILSLLFFALCPIFPAYAIIGWKDPIFSCALLASSILLFRIAQLKGKSCKARRYVALLTVGLFATVFFRNNGIFIVFVILVASFTLLKNKVCKIAISAVLVASAIITGPIYSTLGIKSEPAEALGVPLQQIAYTVSKSDAFAEDISADLSNFIAVENLKELYEPAIVDPIKTSPMFNTEYFNNHIGEFLGIWAKGLRTNFGDYVKAYALETFGFWDPFVFNSYGYADVYISENSLGISYLNIFGQETTTGLQSFLGGLLPTLQNTDQGFRVTTGLLFWLVLISFTLSLMQKDKAKIIFYIPSLACWLAIMVATPVAFSLRYVFVFMIELPIIMLLSYQDQANG